MAYLRNRYVNEVLGCGEPKEMKPSPQSSTEQVTSTKELLEALEEAIAEVLAENPELRKKLAEKEQAELTEQEE